MLRPTRDEFRELAEALRSGQRVDEARKVLEAAIEEFGRRRSPERASVHFLLGRTLRADGVIAGFGTEGYLLALRRMASLLGGK